MMSQKKGQLRQCRGNMLVLVAVVTCLLLVPLFLLQSQIGLFMVDNKRVETVVEGACLMAANDLSRIIINDPHFGYVSLSNYPATGAGTLAPDGEPLPVTGINTLVATIRQNAIIAQELNNSTMQEMAESGAKVLNAQAVEWARKNRVAILARRTGDVLRESPPRETIVSTDGGARQLSVVVQRATALLSASGNAAGRLFTALARAAVPLGDLSAASDGIVAWAPLTNVPNFGEAERILESAEIPGLVVEHGFGLLSLVGVEIAARPELLGKALGLLAEAPRACFVHPLRLSVALPVDQLEDAAKSWHSAFVGSAEGTLLSA